MNKLMIACASALMMMVAIPTFASENNPEASPKQTETNSYPSREKDSKNSKEEGMRKKEEKKCKKGEGKCKKNSGQFCKGKKGGKGDRVRPNHKRGGQPGFFSKKVLSSMNLTSEQTQKLEALYKEQQTKMEARRADQAKKAEKERKKINKEMKGFETKLEKILTPEQFASYKAKMEAERSVAKSANKEKGKRFKGEFRGERKQKSEKLQTGKDGIGEIKECPVQQPL